MWYTITAKLLKRYNGTTNAWELVEDQKAIDAYTNAATAQDTADGKRRVFTAEPITPYDVGDLWAGGTMADLKKCKTQRLTGAYNAADWELATNAVAQDTLYNNCKVTNAGGFQVLDNLGVVRWQAGNLSPGHYGSMAVAQDGTTVVLDDTGIINSWCDSIVDNLDATHKLKLQFEIPSDALSVKKVKLSFTLEAFRSYETTLQNWTIGTLTSSGSSEYNTGEASGVESHSHSMSHNHTVNVPNHGHGINFGIYEDTSATGVKIYVDGTLRLDNGGGGYTTNQTGLDLSSWVTTPGVHYLELSSTQLGRINAMLFVQVFLGV
jgi:hypothetical protein